MFAADHHHVDIVFFWKHVQQVIHTKSGQLCSSLKTEDGESYVGFVVYESANNVVIRDMTGADRIIPRSNIESREMQDFSMMPPGLTNALSHDEFAALVDYLESLR